MNLFGEHDPIGGDGYVPGAWDEARRAKMDGHISDEAYEALREKMYGVLTVGGLTKQIHASNEWQYDECDHGTYSGGNMHGEPYKMCEIFAKHILKPDA